MRARAALLVASCAATLAICGAFAQADMATVRLGTPPTGPVGARRIPPPPTGYVVEGKTAPVVDGVLDDAAWKQVRPLSLGTMRGRGRPGAAAQVLLLHHKGQLYIGFRLDEPRVDKMRRTVKEFDGPAYQDDSVEVFLAPRGGSRWYQFIVGAGGALADSKDRSRAWNSGARHAVAVGKAGWSVELAVPFSVLGVTGMPRVWRGNFYRNRHAGTRGENNAWSPTMRNDYDVPERFGRLVFGNPPPPKPKEVKPVVRAKSATVLPAANGEAVVHFDLSSLPKNPKVLRADLLVFRTAKIHGQMPEAMVNIEIFPLFAEFKAGGKAETSGRPLALRGPWYDRFDATDAVRNWAAGKTNGGFFVKTCPLFNADATCLDICYEGKPGNVPPQVTGVKAVHRSGQTFITWKEISDPVGTDRATWGQLKAVLDGLDRNEQLRYCVYRHTRPITATNLRQAELIATVKPLSCWNVNGRNIDRPVDDYIATANGLMTGHGNPFGRATQDGKFGVDCPIDRLVIRDGGKPLPRGTGLYVRTVGRNGKAGRAYYAVVTCRDGVQNTRDISAGNTAAVDETAGIGEPVLQRELPRMPFFNYKQKRLHYVRWVAPPFVNIPSQYYNWSVGVPDDLGRNVPLELNFHRDGHSYWRTHYRIERDSVVLCPHDFPVKSWWYGYHESLGTLRSFGQGAIQPYTERRLLAFIEWAEKKWPVDPNRVLVTGCCGGASGSGALHLALRHPDVFNLVIAGHPYIDYAGNYAGHGWDPGGRRARRTARSLSGIWGRPEWKLKTAGGVNVWELLDLNRVVAGLPASTELPFMAVTSNHGYADCRKFYEHALTKHFGIIAGFSWGGTRYIPVSNTGTYPTVVRLDIRKNKSLLACVTAAGMKYATKGGMGGFNRQFRWRDVVDEPGRYEATIFLVRRGRAGDTADVVPRRLQRFKVEPGKAYAWKNVGPDGKTEIQRGEATAGTDGLLVLKDVKFSAGGSRLVVTPK